MTNPTLTEAPPSADELERFRQEWQEEVRQRKGQGPSNISHPRADSGHRPSPPSTAARMSAPPLNARQSDHKRPERSVTAKGKASDFDRQGGHARKTSVGQPDTYPTSPPRPARTVDIKQSRQDSLAVEEVTVPKAVDNYAKAVEFENMGKLNEALQLYRSAYKLDGKSTRSRRCSYPTMILKQTALE